MSKTTMKKTLFLIFITGLLVGCSTNSVDSNCPALKDIPLEDWNPIMIGHPWSYQEGVDNVNLNSFMDDDGKMKTSLENRWLKYLKTQELNGYEIVEANPNCWAYKNKVGYNPNYNYCYVELRKNILGSGGNVKEVLRKTLVIIFDNSVKFPMETTAVGGDDFDLWTFTNLTFVESYCK